MWLVIEIFFILVGVWILVTRKIPKFLFGAVNNRNQGNVDRLIGLALVLPIPLSLLGGFVLGLLLGNVGTKVIAPLFERFVFLGLLIIAMRLSRQLKQDLESSIEKV